MDNKQSAEIGVASGVGLAAVAIFWPDFISDLPRWSRLAIFWIGVALIVASIAALIKPNWFWRPKSKPGSDAAKQSDEQYIPMQQATARAYGELRAVSSSWSKAADSFAQQGIQERIYFASALAGEIPIYGKHPPSLIYEVIPSDEFKRGIFRDDGAIFNRNGDTKPLYVEIAVKNADLLRAIEQMRGKMKDVAW